MAGALRYRSRRQRSAFGSPKRQVNFSMCGHVAAPLYYRLGRLIQPLKVGKRVLISAIGKPKLAHLGRNDTQRPLRRPKSTNLLCRRSWRDAGHD